MFQHRGSEKAFGLELLALGRGYAQRIVAFQRKFGVNDDGAGRIRQPEHAVGPFGIGQHHLKLVSGGRQRVGYQIVELDFAESAACLFVGEDFLQRNDLLGQRRNFLLGNVDFGQTLAQRLQGFGSLRS